VRSVADVSANRAQGGRRSGDVDSLGQYLREIGKHPLLTRAEEVQLAKRIEKGDTAAKHRLVESNLRLVVVVARPYARHGVPLLDLVQEGTLGLIQAADRFDWRRETKFSTYAVWWIRQAVDRAVCNQADPIRVPIHVHARRRRLYRASQNLGTGSPRRSSLAGVATAANISPQHAEEALTARRSFISLDGPEGGAVGVADPHAGDEYERVELRLSTNRLEQLLSLLQPASRRVIELRFGVGCDECSEDLTAQLLEIPPGTVRELERDAIQRLRELYSPVELHSLA
jgi:RNA polymerase primary sigma factor